MHQREQPAGPRVTVYSKPGCHLCEEATRVVARVCSELSVSWTEVDIEDVLRFREILEVGAAGLCATHGLAREQADRLREALARTGDAPLSADSRRAATPRRCHSARALVRSTSPAAAGP